MSHTDQLIEIATELAMDAKDDVADLQRKLSAIETAKVEIESRLHIANHALERLSAPGPREPHLTASTREGRTAEVSKCHAAGHLVAVNSAIEFERQWHWIGNRYLPR
jgi:hypothetical protein